MKKKLNIIIASGALGFNFMTLANANSDIPQEKCYCIARAAQNDCASSLHNCAGLSNKDFDCRDWKYVASGSCVDIGGSTVEGKSPTS